MNQHVTTLSIFGWASWKNYQIILRGNSTTLVVISTWEMGCRKQTSVVPRSRVDNN